jgi:hypothetical protein
LGEVSVPRIVSVQAGCSLTNQRMREKDEVETKQIMFVHIIGSTGY